MYQGNLANPFVFCDITLKRLSHVILLFDFTTESAHRRKMFERKNAIFYQNDITLLVSKH